MKLFFGTIYPEIKIHEEEQQHIVKVLRMKAGETIFLTDGEGNLAKGELELEGKKAVLKNVEIQEKLKGNLSKLHIAIAPTKNIDRTEFFVEKATELGIDEITFLITDKSERKQLNIDKIRKQAIAASKQSLRVYFPKINEATKLSEFIKTISPAQTFVAHCDENFERIALNALPIAQDMVVLIGPEGDFSPKEIQMLSEKGIKAVSFGTQRLRTETAGVFVAAHRLSMQSKG